MQKQVQILKQQAFVEEEDEEELTPREKLRRWLERLQKLGIVMTYSYHCKRCNHVWFPKEFDAIFESDTITNDYIVKYPTPKACARCKSRYWNSPPKRKTQHSSMKPIDDTQAKLRSKDLDKMRFFGHDMLTTKRLKTRMRLYRGAFAEMIKAEKKYREYYNKHGIDTTKLDIFKKALDTCNKVDPNGDYKVKKQMTKKDLEEFSKEYYGK